MSRRAASRLLRVVAGAAISLVAAIACPGRALADDPSRTWQTIDTPHFSITYSSGEDRLARHLATAAERAHDELVPLYDHEPKNRTQLLLSDDGDDANGSATAYPYTAVRLFAPAPDDRSELSEFDDWMLDLITHEYTHIIHLDTTHGVARVINFLLGFGEHGQLYTPNGAQPSFIIEGFAIFEESEQTSGGRLRSSIDNMWLRMAALEGKLQRLDQFSNQPIQFPQAESAHFYGGMFLGYIGYRFGQDVFRRLSHEYGGTVIPGGMNRALKKVTTTVGSDGKSIPGLTFSELYDDFHKETVAHYRADLAAVESAGRVEGEALTGPRVDVLRPTFTRDGRSVLWSDNDGYSRPQLRTLDLARLDRWKAAPMGAGAATEKRRKKEIERPPLHTYFLVDGAGGSAFSPDGGTLYFNALEVHRTVYFYNDLFALDVRSGHKTQLTHGLRAANPDLSPDGKTLVFEVLEPGCRSLYTLPADAAATESGHPPEPTRLLGNLDDLSQVYTPTFSPDGKTVAFSWWRPGGYRDIWTIDVATRATTRITADRALDLDPRYSPDGRYLYFSSDRTGIFNLYAYELANGKTWQVTNLIGGAFDAAIAPDGKSAVYVGFVADGYRLERIELDPARFRPAPGLSDALRARPDPRPLGPDFSGPARGYRAYETAWPHLLGGGIAPDAFGEAVFLSLTGGDIVGHHAWSFSLSYGLGRLDDVGFSASYTYSGLLPTFALTADRFLTKRAAFVSGGNDYQFVEDDYSATAYVNLPILRRINESADLALDYNFAYLRNVDVAQLPFDSTITNTAQPETGRVASVGLGFAYSNLRRYLYSVGPEEGQELSFTLGVATKALGSEYEILTASWEAAEYISLGGAHSLSLRYSGGVSAGDMQKRSVFYLGGYADQPDLLRAVFDFTRPGGASLRGYPWNSVSGKQFHAANLEYRFPIAWIERGYDTFPLYLRRLHGALFVDYGNAFDGDLDLKDFKLGAGAELRLDLIYGYYYPAALQLGYARGFMAGGGDQFYLYLNNPF